MKIPFPTGPRFQLSAAALLGGLALGGCLEKRLVWSPDGSRAAVVAKDGLRLCGPDGALSGLLAPGVYLAAWAGDAQHMVLAQHGDLNDSASIASALGQARAEAIAAKAENIWRQLKAGRPPDDVGKDEGSDITAEIVFLRERHGSDLPALLGKQWDDIAKQPATLSFLVAARVSGDRLEMGPVLYRETAEITEIRPSPGGRFVAFTVGIDPNPQDDFRILAAPVDGSAPAALVAEHTAAFPDWMADGRGLAYLQASGGGAEDDLRLGALVQRPILDAAGRIHPAGVAREQEQVGLILHPLSRVRCLMDGRVIFDAMEFHLPIPKIDQPGEEQLFVLTPGKKPEVRPLISLAQRKRIGINLLSFFEVSPDETQVLVGGGSGEVWLVNPAADRVVQFSGALAGIEHAISPEWRGAGEFTYERAFPADPASKTPRAEVVLHRLDGDTVLSRTWPGSLMTQFLY
jgi:hypothetical protein